MIRRGESSEDVARRFYLEAVERGTRRDDARMERALRAARSADSNYLPALLITGPSYLRPYADLLPSQIAEVEAFSRTLRDSALGSCVRDVLAVQRGWWKPIVLPPHASEATTLCAGYHALLRRIRRGSRERIETGLHLWRRYPESAAFAHQLVYDLQGKGEESIQLTREMTRFTASVWVRLAGYVGGIEALHAVGRHVEAMRRERAAERDLRSQPDLVRLWYFESLPTAHERLANPAGADSALARHAREMVDSAQDAARELRARAYALTSLFQRLGRAKGLLDNGNLEASLAEWNGLLPVADRMDSAELRAFVLVHRGRTLVKLGRVIEAERDLLAGREVARRADRLNAMFEAEHNLLHLYEALGRDPDARRAGEAFVALTAMGENVDVHLMANRDFGWYYQHRGERERARPYFETMLAYADSLGGTALQWAGEYFELTGDLERAENHFVREGPGQNTYRAYAGLARLAEATGDTSRAFFYARAHDAGLEHAAYPEVAPLLPGLLARSGRFREAVAELQRARRAALLRGQTAAWATLSAELASLQLRLGDWPAAAATADSATDAAARVALADVRLRAAAISGLAMVRMEAGRTSRGLARIRETVREATRMRLPELEAQLAVLHAEAEAARGDDDRALVLLDRAGQLADSIALSLASDPKRAGFRAAQLHISNRAMAIILRRAGRPGAAEEFAGWSVRRKSRGVVEQYRGVTGRSGGSLRQVHARLGVRDAVVDYVVLDTTVVALIVTDRRALLRRLPVTAESLGVRVTRLVARLAPRMGNVVDTLHSRFDTLGAAGLYADLLAPLEQDLGGRDRLTIVADGPLHQLPFDALMRGKAGEGDGRRHATGFALERFTMSLAPSLAVAGDNADVLGEGPTLAVAVAAPDGSLAGAEHELAAIRAAMGPAGVRTLAGAAATEAAIRASTSSVSLLHLAAHARANDADPGSSSITLSRSGTDDGLLHAYEIEHLPLTGTLVVLSACETGAGRLVGGEGVLSLSRAFLRAGARATVATLWPVGEPAADLMGEFYRGLAARLPAAVALRNAKLELVRGKRASPLVWAPFVLVARAP